MIYSLVFISSRRLRTGIGVLVGLVLLLLAPVSAHGQSPVSSLIEKGRAAGADASRLQAVASRAEAAGLSPQQTATLLQPTVTLAERDLPSTPLLNKTLEGLAKRVPPQRMTPVIQQLQSHTEKAGTLVSAWMNRDEVQALLESGASSTGRNQLITSIAEARQQTRSTTQIEAFLTELPEAMGRRSVTLSEVAAAVSVMPNLPTAASAPDAARSVLTAALRAGYNAESLRQLPVALKQAAQASGRSPAALAQEAVRAIKTGGSAPDVIRDLSRGAAPQSVSESGGGGAGVPETPPGQSNPPPPRPRPAPGDGSNPPNGGDAPDRPEGGRPDNPGGGAPNERPSG